MNYPGGKGATYRHIINLIPPHDVYVEPFLGGGAVMRHKLPAAYNIGCDMSLAALETFAGTLSPAPAICKSVTAARASLADNGGASAVHLFINADAITVLADLALPDTAVVYCDPPYLFATRRGGRMYTHEFGDHAEHDALLDILLTLKCRVMISGYLSDLYTERLQDWSCVSWQAVTRAGTMATEYLWCNFPPPNSLHDYRYLGDNYRERERIKRQRKRWIARLRRMDRLQRLAMISAIAEAFPDIANRSHRHL